jgi:hypothetical protein
MAIPTKKVYGRNGKLIFDPSNPEDVRNYKEKQPLMEALKLVQGLTDPRTGGGLTGATRIINRAANAKIDKTKFAQNKAKQILELVTKPMTRGKKAVTRTVKKATTDVPANVVSPRSAKSERISSLSNQLPSSRFNPNIVTSTARKKSKEIGGFKIGESAIETSKASKVVPKTTPTVTPTVTPKADALTPNIPTRVPSLRGYTPEEAKQVMKDIVLKNKGKENKVAARRSLEGKIISLIAQKETGFRASVKQSIEESNKKAAMTIGALTGVLGAGAGTTYYGMGLSNKDNKQTTNTQKTGPVDLKRIDKSKLKPSKVEGVYITSALVDGRMKDFGIKWNNTTKGWEYYKGDGKPVVKQTTPKQETVKENTGGGGYTPIKDNKKTTGTGGGNQTTTTGGGSGTKTPVKPTVAPVTSTYVGDEYYKANPDLEKAIQEDSIRQQREMYTEKMSKPLSSIVFKPTSKAVDVRNVMDEQDALRSIRADNKLPLKKKRYGGNLAMLKYMK